jgi:RNA polymerase sigma factor (sigma-70 family)
VSTPREWSARLCAHVRMVRSGSSSLTVRACTVTRYNAFDRPPSRHVACHRPRAGTGWRLGGDDAPLIDVEAVVRRTLAARTRDQHLVEDLTQETLARLTGTQHRFSPDAERAYAVVTARNLLASHYRRQSVRGRHLHRLLDDGGSDDPAQATLDREESEAMTSALGQLDPAERDLLMRHEVSGTDLATLADEANVTSGAIAMRLARARANLRLEFLLAFRRMRLPTDQCRPVLLAFAVGDRRRQAQLDADEHVRTCPACAELVGPMTQRDRRIAGWLLIPIAEGLRRGWRALRSHPVHAASAALILGGTGALVFASRSPDDEAAPATVVTAAATATAAPVASTTVAPTPSAAPASAAPSVARTPAPAPAPPTSPAPAPAPPTAPAPPGTSPATEPPCPAPAPLDEMNLADALGCPFAESAVTVTAVSGGGFQAVTTAQRPVSVDVGGGLGLPVTLVPGLRLTITGTVTSESAVVATDVRLAG